ncbi:MAG: spore coat protein [Firmicutes bacterium]|nr:spore coat protein [Alicyclobacillaceae bacterium]MCL6496293.1 spore coat protein [Bacillota bacterium]
MAKLTPSEYLQIHEIASSHATLLAKLTGYLSFVQDPDLEHMLESARRKAETHYRELIEIAQGESLDRKFEGLDGGLQGRPRNLPARSPAPVQPRAGQGFSDRTIASDCLDCNKSMAVRTIWAATEISHVGLRRALSEMSRFHLDAAYEFYKFMEQKGWYVPLGANENPERWFQQHHQQMMASYQDNDWGNPGSPIPS